MNTEDEAMKFGQMVGMTVLGMASMSTGCSSQPATQQPAPNDGPAIKAVTPFNIDTYRLYTLADYPELTPEEMGRRVLALIASLNTVKDWRIERFREVMGVPIAPVPGRGGYLYSFTMNLPDSGWLYGLDYDARPDKQGWSINFGFSNEGGGTINSRAEMAPVCGMDAHAFDLALQGMGFKVHREYDGMGRLYGFDYKHASKAARVELLLRPKSYTADAAKVQTACVESLLIYGL